LTGAGAAADGADFLAGEIFSRNFAMNFLIMDYELNRPTSRKYPTLQSRRYHLGASPPKQPEAFALGSRAFTTMLSDTSR
jgi:hypothetical protein